MQWRTMLFAACSLSALLMAAPPHADNDRDDRDRGHDNDRDHRDDCDGKRELVLYNGRIHTMDAKNSIVSTVTIHNGRFDDIGRRDDRGGDCSRTIDLHGKTAIPGIIDNHNHFILLSSRPGHHTPLESAFSIADVQAAIKARVPTVPAGAWITSIGAWIPQQFAENRFPTLAELDAAAPNNPVMVFQQFTGPAAVNTKGMQFFAGKGITVSATGQIAGTGAAIQALDALRAIQTADDRIQGSLDAMAYSAKVGVTTNVDMGGFVIPGLPDIQDSFTFDSSASWDPFSAYDTYLTLNEQHRITTRLRIYFLSMDQNLDNPLLMQRLNNAFNRFGNPMMKSAGIGEFATNWPLFGGPAPANYLGALEAVAARGWSYQQHSLSDFEDTLTLTTYQAVNAITPIAPLHWSIAHVPAITTTNINAFKALGVGIAVHPFRYLAAGTQGGPPLRTIVDSGAIVGAGSDSAQISTLNPWNMIYYMTTGKNVAGILVNAGQLLTRQEAIQLYTANNGWFLNEEDKLGSIEQGKYGDLVVLNADYFDTKAVPDTALRSLHSVLTVVDGKVVHNEM
jgi:predicted amidohydrolase YtcJ